MAVGAGLVVTTGAALVETSPGVSAGAVAAFWGSAGKPNCVRNAARAA